MSLSLSDLINSSNGGVQLSIARLFEEGWKKADVLNCSWKTDNSNTPVEDEISLALNNGRNGLGTVVVFASHNYGPSDGQTTQSTIAFPANSIDEIIVVGGASPCGERVSLSSCDGVQKGSRYGDQLDVIAPGILIPTTDLTVNYTNNNIIGSGFNPEAPYNPTGNYFQEFSLTSAAAPHVSGLAGLILSVNPSLCVEQVEQIICETAQKVRPDLYTYVNDSITHPYGSWNEEVGYGLIDAGAAVQMAQQMAVEIQENNVCCETSFIYDINDFSVNENTTQNLVWDENSTKPFYDGNEAYIKGTLTVTENTTLTIENQSLNFSKIGKIVVEKGAILNIENCVLTSTCNTLWKGIEVEGVQGGLTSDQGILNIRNSTISNAENAIANANMTGLDNYNSFSSGGRVIAVNNTFENNRRDIALFPYNGLFSNFAVINNNEFKTTKGIAGPVDQVEHILLENAQGTIINNTFTADPGFEYSRAGIRSVTATATIRNNSFESLDYGIYGFSFNQYRTLQIKNNNFSCRVGAYLNNLVYAKIEENDFTVGQNNLPGNVFQGCIGLELDNCTKYSVQENTFNGQFSGTIFNFGLNVYNSNNNAYSSDNNEIYRNEFNDLNFGTVASGVNRENQLDIGSKGLEYKCNVFDNFTFSTDISVIAFNTNQGIKTLQGFPTTALGSTRSNNQFTRPANNNRNVGILSLTNTHYFFHDDGFQGATEVYPTEPLNSTNTVGVLFPNSFNPAVECPSQLPGNISVGGLVAESISLNNQIAATALQIDGGNTQDILDFIQLNNQDYLLHNELLSKSPGLSDEVLIALINKQPVVSDYVIDDVLTANAPLSNPVWNNLLNRATPVAEYVIHELALLNETVQQERQLQLINSPNNYSDWLIKDVFQHFSPLTDDVLIALINRSPALAEWVVHDIMMTNTPLSQDVNTALLNRTPALQQWVINNINNSTFVAGEPQLISTQVSAARENQLKIDYYEAELQKVENELIRRYIFESDSVTDYLDSILPLIDDTTRRENNIRQADLFALQNDTVAAQNRLIAAVNQDASLNDYANLRYQLLSNQILINGCQHIDSCNTLKSDIDILAQQNTESINEVKVSDQLTRYMNNEYGGEHFDIPNEVKNKSMVVENEDKNPLLENEDDFIFTLYPNPNSGSFHVTFNQNNVDRLVIEDNTGKRVKEISVREMHHYVDMNQSASGVYFVKVLSNQEEVLEVKKLVVY